MTNQVFNPQPSYSGVTIQIANPAVNLSPYGHTNIPVNQLSDSQNINSDFQTYNTGYQSPQPQIQSSNQGYPCVYPPQYYLNNYNTTNVNGKDTIRRSDNPNEDSRVNTPNRILNETEDQDSIDMTSSDEIINDINERVAEQKELKKNTKEKRIIALTDDYIRSLENYLDNANDEVRLMASKEILKRLDEDKNRYDDAALNALLNKMLQDPSKLVRIAALSAFSSQLASGNDYTVKLLREIQTNPNSDKEDVMQAADSLLKMSADVEIKNVPITTVKTNKKGSKV